MKKPIHIFALTSLVFSLGVMADEAIRDNGWFWYKLSDVRQLGYVEGFTEGAEEQSTFGVLCKKPVLPELQATGPCILSRLRGHSQAGQHQREILDTMVKFYALPQNLPVSWGHAVIISGAMASGVPVDEKDLQVIRKEDATPPKRLSEQETRDLLNGGPPRK